jgi:hypothetical protein
MKLVTRLSKAPVVHFMILGALAFALFRSSGVRPLFERKIQPEIVIDAAGLDGKALDDAIEEEILVREALALGIDRDQRVVDARLKGLSDFLELDRDPGAATGGAAARTLDYQYRDPIIRRHLATLVRMMLSRVGPADFPSEAELEAYLEANAAAFASPARVRFTHIYLSRDRHGASLAADAERLAETLASQHIQPRDSAALGDPFAYGSRQVLAPLPEIERTFGAEFTAAISKLQPGAWSEPIDSPYGSHLVWMEERIPGRAPALNEVKTRVLHEVLAQRRESRLREGLAELRGRYHGRVVSQSDEMDSDR